MHRTTFRRPIVGEARGLLASELVVGYPAVERTPGCPHAVLSAPIRLAAQVVVGNETAMAGPQVGSIALQGLFFYFFVFIFFVFLPAHQCA